MSAVEAIRRQARRSSQWRRAVLLYVALLLAAGALVWPSAATMIGQWLASSSFHHAPFVVPIGVWLIARRCSSEAPQQWPAALGAAAVILAAWAIARRFDINLAEHFAIVSLAIALAAFAFGRAYVGARKFEFAFLFLMVPFGASAQPPLQYIAANGAHALLALAGFDVALSGAMIDAPFGPVFVAPSCAGLNFVLAATMIAWIFSSVVLEGWRERAAFLALAVAGAIACNLLRVAGVIGASMLMKDPTAFLADHLVVGWAFYATMIVALIGAGRRLAAPARL